MSSYFRGVLSALFFTAIFSMLPGKALADDSRLDSMVSPVSNPVNFEDPRASSDVRVIYMFHKLDGDFITGSGDVQLWAAQARLALTDRLAFIATKDGYVQLNADKVLDDDEGSANLAAGFKYAVLKDDAAGTIGTVGLRYELASGSPEVFQGQGDGVLNPFFSGAVAVDDLNLMGYTGLRIPMDSADSGFWDLSLHADYQLGNFYPLVELNLVHVYDAGNRIGLDGEGFDVINFGSSNSEGSTVVTAAVGGRYRACKWADLGLSYEFALTDRKDVFDWRLTTDIIFGLPI